MKTIAKVGAAAAGVGLFVAGTLVGGAAATGTEESKTSTPAPQQGASPMCATALDLGSEYTELVADTMVASSKTHDESLTMNERSEWAKKLERLQEQMDAKGEEYLTAKELCV